MSGLKSNIKNLYEDVESFHQSPQSATRYRQIIYDPNKVLGSEKSYSSPDSGTIKNIPLDGPASIKKALKQEFNCSP